MVPDNPDRWRKILCPSIGLLLLITCSMYYFKGQRQSPYSNTPFLLSDRRHSHQTLSLDSSNPHHILTLFTSWGSAGSKSHIQNRTIRNWSKLYPSVVVVVYTDDVTVMSNLKSVPGCYVRTTPMVLTERRLPVLKHMYTETMSHFKSKYYSFVNSDILFTSSLLDTLNSLDKLLGNNTNPIFLVGQRWNVLNITDAEASSDTQILRTTKIRGTLMPSWAADFFITNKLFPWQYIPDVVIGVPNFDNWLMMTAKSRNYTAIDITLTTVAVHQSKSNNAYESSFKPFNDFNRKLLNTYLSINGSFFLEGRVDCLRWFTEYDAIGVRISYRTKYKDYCQENTSRNTKNKIKSKPTQRE